MSEIINMNKIKFVEVEKPKDTFNFLECKNKILNNQKLNNCEINKIWCIIAFLLVLSFLIYELCNLQYLK